MARFGLCADSNLISGKRVEFGFLFYNVKIDLRQNRGENLDSTLLSPESLRGNACK